MIIKEVSLAANIFVYLILISVIFLKITDKLHRPKFENILMILLMFWAIFVAGYLTKTFSEAVKTPINIYDITFVTSRNILIITYTIYKLFFNFKKRQHGKI
jgi:hypothetical protein